MVYVLHVFQKKSKRGITTPKKEVELIRKRLKLTEQDHKRERATRTGMSKDETIIEGEGNVFDDLGLPVAVRGMNDWFGYSPQRTCGLPQTPRTHSFAQAGA